MSEEGDVSVGRALEDALENGSRQGAGAAGQAAAGDGPAAGGSGHAGSEGGARPGAEINLHSLLDVPVTLSVEIGRARLPIKQLVSLNQGSVIELDREVNEPLDLLVNGTLMARGEVVVVDGQFGLRLVDIVSPAERLNKLK